MQAWDPAATKEPLEDSGSYIAGPWRIVLHTTEGGSYAGALAAYKKNRSAPHFTASYENGKFRHWQHVALDRAARSLEHRKGTVHTNRLSAVQIEVVAKATNPAWPQALAWGVSDLLAWIMAQADIAPVFPPFKPYPASYGEKNGVRFPTELWLTFNGICGHQHVPNQSHGDPGAIDVAGLLPAAVAPTESQEGIVAVNRPPVRRLDDPLGRGYWIITDDGGVFSFTEEGKELPFHGSLGGTALNAPIIDAGVTADGGGYWMMGGDGGMFAFGNAEFWGRVEYGG